MFFRRRYRQPSVHATDVMIFFFFQAEDGIRDGTVTGVQTRALPILDSKKQEKYTAQMKVDLRLQVQKIAPGGQDRVPTDLFVPENSRLDFEQDEAFTQAPPIVIPVAASDCEIAPAVAPRSQLKTRSAPKPPGGPSQPSVVAVPQDQAPYYLALQENTSTRRQRTLRLSLHNPNSKGSEVQRVVVLDRNPFLVAEVDFEDWSSQSPGDASDLIATWSNADSEGGAWLVRTQLEKGISLILPPQGIGEQSEKRKTFDKEDAVADYRFSPPAVFQVFPSYFERRYTEAPWNLRRILGFPGQRAPGPAIKRIDYELLYGLSCTTDYPFLRLADSAALVGEIPGRLPDLRWTATPSQDTAWNNLKEEWSKIHRQYLNRLAILQPWDAHQPGSLLLNENLSCRLRPDADLRRPVQGKECITDPSFTDYPEGSGLQGGAVWGFESRNVYCASIRDPHSFTARLVAPLFSAMGGSGSQVAEFDNGLTRITGDVQ